MELVIEIEEDKAAFAMQVLKSLSFVQSVHPINQNTEPYTEEEIKRFNEKWNDPTNMTPDEMALRVNERLSKLWQKSW